MLFAIPSLIKAQEGKYLNFSGFIAYSQVANSGDLYTPSVTLIPKTTYFPAAGVSYINNFENMFGFETGIIYAMKGQKYKGDLVDTFGEYNSRVTLSYLQLPVLFRFNSTLDNDIRNVYLCIKAGFQVGYLMDAGIKIDSPSPDFSESNIEVKDLFKPIDVAFIASAIFNFRLSDTWWINAGIKMDRGFSDVENKSYDFPANTPPEYQFPVSARYIDHPPRNKTTNNLFSLELGVSYRIQGP